jgi:toxin ParE1/3/4
VTTARLRPLAETDLVERTRHYRSCGGEPLGERFFDAAVASVRAIERNPGIGSPLAGETSDTPGLRSWPVKAFPVRWHYFAKEDYVDVVRLLADAQDLPTALTAGDI